MNNTSFQLTTSTMIKERETKGTFVYTNTDKDAVIPTLYIKKAAFEGTTAPEKIQLTISEV